MDGNKKCLNTKGNFKYIYSQ